jgi:biotin carboxyl carrier protein
MLDRGIARHGYDAYVGDAKAGVVTSGTQTPFLKKAIGMAYLPIEHTASDSSSTSTSAAGGRARASCRCRSTTQEAAYRDDGVSGRLQVHQGPRVDRLAGERGKVGITDYAQQQLGDVVYIELPEVGAKLKQGQSFGTIESVKGRVRAVSPVAGEVVEVNAALKDKPRRSTPIRTAAG